MKVPGQDNPIQVGQLELYRFPNPVGLTSVGDDLMKLSNASGNPIAGRPGFDGMGKTVHKFLEMSNVSVVREMVNMIVAQRAYEFNSKAIQTSDNMLGTATSLKRGNMKCRSTRHCCNTTTAPSSVPSGAAQVAGTGARVADATRVDKKSKLYEQCQEFESIFVKMMLKEMRNSVDKTDSLLSGGWAEDIYRTCSTTSTPSPWPRTPASASPTSSTSSSLRHSRRAWAPTGNCYLRRKSTP